MHDHGFIGIFRKDNTAFVKAAVQTGHKDRSLENRYLRTADIFAAYRADQILKGGAGAGFLDLAHVKDGDITACNKSEKMTFIICDGKGFGLLFLEMIPGFPERSVRKNRCRMIYLKISDLRSNIRKRRRRLQVEALKHHGGLRINIPETDSHGGFSELGLKGFIGHGGTYGIGVRMTMSADIGHSPEKILLAGRVVRVMVL
jgi:hypothetical protein